MTGGGFTVVLSDPAPPPYMRGGEGLVTAWRRCRALRRAGQHTVHLQIDWARSPRLELNVAPGQVIALECAPTKVPPFGPGAGAYIELRHAGRPGP